MPPKPTIYRKKRVELIKEMILDMKPAGEIRAIISKDFHVGQRMITNDIALAKKKIEQIEEKEKNQVKAIVENNLQKIYQQTLQVETDAEKIIKVDKDQIENSTEAEEKVQEIPINNKKIIQQTNTNNNSINKNKQLIIQSKKEIISENEEKLPRNYRKVKYKDAKTELSKLRLLQDIAMNYAKLFNITDNTVIQANQQPAVYNQILIAVDKRFSNYS